MQARACVCVPVCVLYEISSSPPFPPLLGEALIAPCSNTGVGYRAGRVSASVSDLLLEPKWPVLIIFPVFWPDVN